MPNAIYDIKAICKRHPMYNAAGRDHLMSAIMSANGHALAVVHPLYSIPKDRPIDIELAVRDRWLMENVFEKKYGDYFFGLNAYLEKKNLPFFVFINNGMRETVEKWLGALSIASPGALIETRESPLPVVDDEEIPWDAVNSFAAELGVRSISIAGEMFFHFSSALDGSIKESGCVATLKDSMAEFKPIIITSLTYPATTLKVLLR